MSASVKIRSWSREIAFARWCKYSQLPWEGQGCETKEVVVRVWVTFVPSHPSTYQLPIRLKLLRNPDRMGKQMQPSAGFPLSHEDWTLPVATPTEAVNSKELYISPFLLLFPLFIALFFEMHCWPSQLDSKKHTYTHTHTGKTNNGKTTKWWLRIEKQTYHCNAYGSKPSYMHLLDPS